MHKTLDSTFVHSHSPQLPPDTSETPICTPHHLQVEGFHRTHSGNAELFAKLFGDLVRYDYAARRWLVWSGNWWTLEEAGEVNTLAKELARWRARAA